MHPGDIHGGEAYTGPLTDGLGAGPDVARLPAGLDPGLEPTRPPAPRGRLPRHPQHPLHPRLLAVIALGGFAGGLARYGLGLAFPAPHSGFPAATFAINVSGSFILALLIVFVLDVWPPSTYIRPLLGTGFCGAYTTFSTWAVGVDQLLAAGRTGLATEYLFGSLAAGLAATSLGLTSGRAVVAHRRRLSDQGGRA